MAIRRKFRQFAVLKATPSLMKVYSSQKLEDLEKFTRDLLEKMHAPSPLLQPNSFSVASAPSLDWKLEVIGQPDAQPPDPKVSVISYAFSDPDVLAVFRDFVLKNIGKPVQDDPDGNTFLEIGADIGGDKADHWCPGGATAAMFGNRKEARRVLNADVLENHQLRGQNVNVVIFDDGLDRYAIPAPNWGGGLNHLGTAPGAAPVTSHGMLVVRNVLDIAPDAVVYDVPMIPSRITNVPVFAIDAFWSYLVTLLWISFLRQFPRWSGPWVFVNAWAIYDRYSELPLGDYTENTHPLGHPFNKIVRDAAETEKIDLIFAAGNCGQFCPSSRCGKLDRGPGHSIWGANSHFAVITVGAVRTDELWLGYSSQGPGPSLLRRPRQPRPNRKPDLCAPSQFRELTDAYVEGNVKLIPPIDHPRTNTGTSTSCALTAGVVAALRSNPLWDASTVSPSALKHVLIQTARKTRGPNWNERLGYGVLDASAAYNRLP